MKGGGERRPGGESGVAPRPPAGAPPAPPHPSPPFVRSMAAVFLGREEGGGGDWQAISDVMPAVQ